MLYAHTVGTDEVGDRATGQASWAYWIFLPKLHDSFFVSILMLH